jgi:hypothetical protein
MTVGFGFEERGGFWAWDDSLRLATYAYPSSDAAEKAKRSPMVAPRIAAEMLSGPCEIPVHIRERSYTRARAELARHGRMLRGCPGGCPCEECRAASKWAKDAEIADGNACHDCGTSLDVEHMRDGRKVIVRSGQGKPHLCESCRTTLEHSLSYATDRALKVTP